MRADFCPHCGEPTQTRDEKTYCVNPRCASGAGTLRSDQHNQAAIEKMAWLLAAARYGVLNAAGDGTVRLVSDIPMEDSRVASVGFAVLLVLGCENGAVISLDEYMASVQRLVDDTGSQQRVIWEVKACQQESV